MSELLVALVAAAAATELVLELDIAKVELVVLLGTGSAVDSVKLAFCFAIVGSNILAVSTSRYAHPGTEVPAGIGLGKLPTNTVAQFVVHSFHNVIVAF